MSNTRAKTVVIMGAGNAGLFAAHILKHKRPGLNIIVVGSKELGIVGVGESSTEHIYHVMKALGVNATELAKHTGSTFKFGVSLDWHEKYWVHSLFSGKDDPEVNSTLHNNHDIYRIMAQGSDPKNTVPENVLTGMLHPSQLPNQLHFDTYLLNNYMIEKAKAKGINVYDDIITDFNFRDDGTLESIESETNIYPGDLFIDASGFARLLSKQVSEFEWVSQQHNMFCDSAFAFATEHTEDNYLPFTNAKKMSAGWMWQIPVHHRQGNGYVYSSKHISYEDAVKEVEEELGHSIDVAKTFNFEAGHYNKTWHKNMILCGLSSHFFEPLEATSMGVGINQARLAIQYIASDDYDDSMIESYNREVQRMFKQMWTFLRLHYHNAVPDSPFWKDVAKAKVPDEVQKILDITKQRMLVSEDLECNLNWYIFHELNFNQVLYGIGALSKEVASTHEKLSGRVYSPDTIGTAKFAELLPEFEKELLPHRDYIEGLISGTIPARMNDADLANFDTRAIYENSTNN
jgi:tryptophan 7-halogenase